MALLHDRGRQTILVTRILDFTIFIFRQRQYYIRYYLTLSLECTYSSRDCERKKERTRTRTVRFIVAALQRGLGPLRRVPNQKGRENQRLRALPSCHRQLACALHASAQH